MTKKNKVSNLSLSSFGASYVQYLNDCLSKIDYQQLSSFVKLLDSARDRSSRCYFIGNGGSASTASHFANDLSIGTKSWEKPIRAISLCDNQGILTAIGNDYDFSEIFTLQLRSQALPDDILVAISASGHSQNLISAVKHAKEIGITSVGITGFDGGQLKELVDVSLHIPTDYKTYGPTEDIHLILNHIIANYFVKHLIH